ncbi:MAG: Peptidase family [Bacteroidota bacterium]|jgi:Zn-dependent protease with chaperone function|nr:Peptidase family [Bacteroidota bacterium]
MRLQFTPQALFIILFCFLINYSNAQFELDYKPVISSGTLPAEFLSTAQSMSEKDISRLGDIKYKSANEDFLKSNNYFLHELLLSGDVLLNDPLSQYVNKVMDELLKGDPSVRSTIKVFVTRSPDVNAFAFDNGYIFVNIGLLAQLENEAQLAYVLSHELTHALKKHSLSQYIENIKLKEGTSDYEGGTAKERRLARYRFSKEHESEADLEGLKMMKATKYSIKAIRGAFDVLQYSYLPFELVEFRKSFFEDEFLTLPDTLNLKKVSDIKANDDYDDTKSTHPNIRKRRGTIDPELVVDDENNRKKFLVSEADFKKIRETSRFELCRLYLVERDYMNAIYASYILLQKYKDNIYLKKIMGKALYNVMVTKPIPDQSFTPSISIGAGRSSSSKQYSIPDYSNIEGPSQRVYYMMENMNSVELNVMALSYVYKAYKQYPEDKALSVLTDSLISHLVYSNNLYLNDFSRKTKTELKAAPLSASVDLEQEESKYTSIKRDQQKAELETADNFSKYALVGLLKEQDFVSRYSRISKGHTKKPFTESYAKPVQKKPSKNEEEKVPYLGIKKVIFLDPYYLKLKDDGEKKTVKYYETEVHQQLLGTVQKECADKLHLEYMDVSVRNLQQNDLEKFNQNALFNDWVEERLKHGNKSRELVTSYEFIEEFIKTAGTKYVAWSGISNSKGKVERNNYFFILMDLETGKQVKYQTEENKGRDDKAMLNSLLYESLSHVVKTAN